jgi:hypothetical protein
MRAAGGREMSPRAKPGKFRKLKSENGYGPFPLTLRSRPCQSEYAARDDERLLVRAPPEMLSP